MKPCTRRRNLGKTDVFHTDKEKFFVKYSVNECGVLSEV